MPLQFRRTAVLIGWHCGHYLSQKSSVAVLPMTVYETSGDVMFLETMPTFQEHWQEQGGLTAFQERARSILNLPESSDNR